MKMEPRTHPKCSCEAKRADEDGKSASDDAESPPEATSAAQNGVSARCEFPKTGPRTIQERSGNDPDRTGKTSRTP